MNKSSLQFFCFVLLFTSSLGQLSFNDPYVSSPGEYTLTQKSNGKILTISTAKGFSWIFPDIMAVDDAIYVTPLCASSGSTTDFGLGSHVTGAYPSGYSRNSVLFPVVGNNYVGNTVDARTFYYPTKPTRGQSAVLANAALDPVATLGQTFGFRKLSTSAQYSLYLGASTNYVTSSIRTFNTISFELLNCGTAKWCIQTLAEVEANTGVCEPSETYTCEAPTCATVTDQTECSTATTLIIDNMYCLTNCPAGKTTKAISATFATCQACTSPCENCSGGDPTKCSSCLAGYFLDTGALTCGQCDNSCKDCSGTTTTCTACYDGSFLNSVSSTCDSCTSPCAKCVDSASKCTACDPNFYLDEDDHTCVATCSAGKYGNDSTGKCEVCQSPCYECSNSATQCTSCVADYFLDETDCLSPCSIGKYGDKNTKNCENCQSPCAQCVDSDSKCTVCIANHYLDEEDNSCVVSCPAGKYANSLTGKCEVCQSPCYECLNSATQCTSCIANYFLDSTDCLSPCTIGKYGDKNTNKCESCTSPCAQCQEESTICTVCEANYYLHKSSCLATCPAGYEADVSSGECKKKTIKTAESGSSKWARWKIALTISLPTFAVLSGISYFTYLKAAARRMMRIHPSKPTPAEFEKVPTTTTANVLSPTVGGIDAAV